MKNKFPPATPFVMCGLVWAAYAIIFPFYRMVHFIPAALLGIAAGLITSRSTVKKPRPQPVVRREEEEAARLDAFAARLRSTASAIKDPMVSASAERVCAIMIKMAEDIEADPSDARRARAFIRNYIPTAIGVYDDFARLEGQNVSGDNISGTMNEIRSSLGSIEGAFEKQLDSMFMDDALGIKTDIDVISQISNDINNK